MFSSPAATTGGQISLRKAEYKWEIGNIKHVMKEVKYLLSPQFSVGGLNWNLELYPKGYSKECDGYVSICLLLKSDVEHATNYSVTIIGNQNLPCHQRICGVRKYASSSSMSWGIIKFIHSQELIDNRDQYLLDNKLVIMLELYPNNYNIYDRQLVSFEDVLNNKDFCNVKFIVKRDDDFQCVYAHKSVLSKRSEVFCAMFEHRVRENVNNVITIEDVEYQVVVEMLRFIYTGEVKNIESMARELLIAAHRYAIFDLIDVCDDYLYHNLSDENAIEYLNFAVIHNLVSLKQNAKVYIISNAKNMVRKPAFRSITDLKNDQLYDIICRLANNAL